MGFLHFGQFDSKAYSIDVSRALRIHNRTYVRIFVRRTRLESIDDVLIPLLDLRRPVKIRLWLGADSLPVPFDLLPVLPDGPSWVNGPNDIEA